MDDTKAIQDAYDDVVDQLFKALFTRCAGAAGDPAIEARAVAAFGEGLVIARRVRDSALAVAKA